MKPHAADKIPSFLSPSLFTPPVTIPQRPPNHDPTNAYRKQHEDPFLYRPEPDAHREESTETAPKLPIANPGRC